jgi:hypothetical protein
MKMALITPKERNLDTVTFIHEKQNSPVWKIYILSDSYRLLLEFRPNVVKANTGVYWQDVDHPYCIYYC